MFTVWDPTLRHLLRRSADVVVVAVVVHHRSGARSAMVRGKGGEARRNPTPLSGCALAFDSHPGILTLENGYWCGAGIGAGKYLKPYLHKSPLSFLAVIVS